MNPAYNFNSSSSSSFHFLDLNENNYIPGYEQYGSTTTHPVLPHQTPASSSTWATIFNLTQDYQRGSHTGDYPQTHHKVDKKIVLVEGSSTGHVFSASYQPTDEDSTNKDDHITMVDHENRSTRTKEHGSTKWMSSKMKVMRKMLHSNNSPGTDIYTPAKSIDDNHSNQINSADHCNRSTRTAEIVRVCSDCNTTKTPLWRGGPQGPKSLCNACGIRRRKAKKAMALAAAEAENDTNSANKMEFYSSTGALKIHSKEKKSRTSYNDVTQSHQTTAKSKLSFEDFAMSLIKNRPTELFLRDEEEAAILLMALSCGQWPYS